MIFYSDSQVWESRYKLVVTFRVVCLFMPIELTKWNRSHCLPNLTSSMYYLKQKLPRQIEVRWDGDNQLKSVFTNFYYMYQYHALTRPNKSVCLGGGWGIKSSRPPSPSPSPVFHFNLALSDTSWGPQKKMSLIALSLLLLQGLQPYFSIFSFHTIYDHIHSRHWEFHWKVHPTFIRSYPQKIYTVAAMCYLCPL